MSYLQLVFYLDQCKCSAIERWQIADSEKKQRHRRRLWWVEKHEIGCYVILMKYIVTLIKKELHIHFLILNS